MNRSAAPAFRPEPVAAMPAQRIALSSHLALILLAPRITAHPEDAMAVLTEADRLAMLYNWPKAAPLYVQAQNLFDQSGDKRNALYARLGWIWTQAGTGRTEKLDSEVEQQMEDPLVRQDAKLMLRCLVTKAALDQAKNEASARNTWERVLETAKRLGEQRWEARAQAELGMITFMDGDVDKATAMIKTAFLSLYLQGDLGAAIYYGSIVGNGQVEVGQPEMALGYCDMALKTTATTKDMGFPFWAYMGKARALVALHREPEAKPLLELAIQQARNQGARAAEAQLLVVMGKQAAASNPEQAIAYLKAAARLSSQNGFRHPYAWSTVELANVYRDQGDLVSAQKYATHALEAMRDLEDKYHMPVHLALMADLAARRSEFRKAETFYQQAADVVEALLINVPSREVESSLIALESQIYLGYFRLAATKQANSTKAFDILETARGRSIADALRSEPIRPVHTDAMTQSARRDINRIQLTLLRETNRNKRENLLEQLFQAEQVIAPVGRPKNRLQDNGVHAHPIPLATLRSSLRPDEMVLEYVLDEPNSFCLRITRQTAAVTVLPAGRKQIEQIGRQLPR